MTPQLNRVLTLPLLTMYGVGTTVGAGIYVLTGTVIEVAGAFAPLSFLAAACLAGLSAASFAELSTRMPRSAGEALYVREGLRMPRLSVVVGLLVAASGVISSAVLTKGFTGYLGLVLDWPAPVFTAILLAGLVFIAIWGIREAVMVAAIITAVEVAGLLLVVWVARDGLMETGAWVDTLLDDTRRPAFALLASGTVLAFFAFIGFEDMVNVAEEVRDVRRTMPRAIILTLLITAFLYFVVSLVALLGASGEALGQSDAPLADIYARATGASPLPIVFIGTLAIVNGALIQIIMGSRVLYGLAAQGQMLLLGRKSAREKILSFLLYRHKHLDPTGRDASIDLPMSRTDIADYLGLTIETVSRTFTALRDEGLIELPNPNHVIFPDIDAVRDVAEAA